MPKPKPIPSAALDIEMWPIDKPQPYPKNARKWGAMAIEKIAQSILEFGFRQPIVVDDKGEIVIGHLRLAGAKRAGLTEVPVHVARDLSPAQIKALRIADNRLHEEAEWDDDLLGLELLDLKMEKFDIDLTGFDHQEIIESVFGKPQKKGRRSPEGGIDASGKLEFKVIVDCTGEVHQAELLKRLKKDGLKCRALIS